MKKLTTLAVLVALTLLRTSPGFAQISQDLKTLGEEIEVLKKGQDLMQKDLQEIKNLIRTRPQAPQPGAGDEEPKDLVLNIEGYPFKGEKTAKLTLVDFTDYQ